MCPIIDYMYCFGSKSRELQEELNACRIEIKDLQTENRKLNHMLKELEETTIQSKVRILQKQNTTLYREICTKEKTIRDLLRENKKYKKECTIAHSRIKLLKIPLNFKQDTKMSPNVKKLKIAKDKSLSSSNDNLYYGSSSGD